MRSRFIEARRTPVAGRAAVASPWVRRPALLLLAAFLLATLAFSSRADAFVYWANTGARTVEGDGTIGRANLDGTGANIAFFEAVEAPCGVAVDGTYIYYANNYYDAYGRPFGGSIARAALPEAEVEEEELGGIVASADDPCGVAVDGAHVYWANGGFDDRPGSIGRANLDGGYVVQDFIFPGADDPCGVAVDGAHVYWAERSTSPDTIGRANLDGTGADQAFITGAEDPCGVAVDAAHVYWANRGADTIGRANLDGTGADQGFITGAEDPCGVAVDGAHVYWANGASSGSIGRANLDGSGVNQSLIAPAGSFPCGVAVDALSSAPAAPGGTANEFSFGKVKRNKKKGTAKLVVKVPGPGQLELAKTKKVKPQAKRARGEGKVQLAIKPKPKSKRALRKTGKAKVVAKVTYTPDGGEPNTESKRLKLTMK